MTKRILISALIIVITAALASAFISTRTIISTELPAGWMKAGSNPEKYEMGIEKNAGMEGNNAATIKSIDKKISGSGKMMQDFLPDNYLGKRIRMTGYMKSKDVDDWAGFWLRVDKKASQPPLSFDNMRERAVKGTTDWKKYEIVLDVPNTATNIEFGASLNGEGQVWFTKMNFEVVACSVPTTGAPNAGDVLPAPTNLSFDK